MALYGILGFSELRAIEVVAGKKRRAKQRWRKRMEMEKASGQANKRKGYRPTSPQTDKQTDKQTNGQTDRQTDKQTNRQTDLNCCSKSSHSRKCKHDQTPANSISCDKHFCHMISLNQESVLKASKIPGRGSTLLGTQLYQAQIYLPRFDERRCHVQKGSCLSNFHDSCSSGVTSRSFRINLTSRAALI